MEIKFEYSIEATEKPVAGAIDWQAIVLVKLLLKIVQQVVVIVCSFQII